MVFKEKKFAYSTDIVKVENGIENVIGMINKEGKYWNADVNGFGRVTDNGYEFTTKKEAKEKVIEKYMEMQIKN